ncbi:MAG: acyl-CoA dehydrogenase [Proteobacteria bacterium]|nr:MAG: acyl-CoA dehydrogenase [Pseudomonadota bacterium]
MAEVARVGREVARAAARAVDAEGRFPAETLAALKACGALGAAVPAELGGGGLGLGALAESCTALAQHCASSAMILAMHHIQVASLADHRDGSREIDAYLRRVAAEQRLIASVTSEVGPGGDMRRSVAAIAEDGARFSLKKQATTISYGREADDLLLTVRRHAGASPHDQVLVLLLAGEYVLTPTGAWDALGMRGTCSIPAVVEGGGAPWQVLATPFGDVAAQSMVPVSHVLWASCWLGIAIDAVAIARAKLRGEARARAGTLPPEAARLAETGAKLQLLRSEVSAATADCARMRAAGDRDALASLGTALRMNDLKLSASRLAVDIVGEALGVCGIAGYRNDSPYSIGRHLRDVLSAPLMIQNQRLLETNAGLWMVGKGEA